MKEDYDCMFNEVYTKLGEKDSEIQKLDSRVKQQLKHISRLSTDLWNMTMKQYDTKSGVNGASLAPDEVQQLKGAHPKPCRFTHERVDLVVTGNLLFENAVQEKKSKHQRSDGTKLCVCTEGGEVETKHVA